MTTYAGGMQAKSGYYIDSSSFAIATITQDGGKLPGGSEARWTRVPVALVMAAAPVLGGLFVVALPFIGFGVAAWAVGRAVSGRARAAADELAATVTMDVVPGEAHLTGQKPADEAGEPVPDERLEKLERDIGEGRAEKK
jgi:hypothetical protein